MSTKKDLKYFLKPHWKKFILPLVFVILFLILVSSFQSLGTFLDKYSCKTETLYKQLDQSKKDNNTQAENQTKKEITDLLVKMQQDAPQGGIVQLVSLYTIGLINPLVPFPCLMISGESGFCQFYVNETTHNCMVESIKNIKLEDFNNTALKNIRFEVKPYTQSSTPIFIASIVILIVEGYLISVLVQIVFVRRKEKVQPKSKN